MSWGLSWESYFHGSFMDLHPSTSLLSVYSFIRPWLMGNFYIIANPPWLQEGLESPGGLGWWCCSRSPSGLKQPTRCSLRDARFHPFICNIILSDQCRGRDFQAKHIENSISSFNRSLNHLFFHGDPIRWKHSYLLFFIYLNILIFFLQISAIQQCKSAIIIYIWSAASSNFCFVAYKRINIQQMKAMQQCRQRELPFATQSMPKWGKS